MTNGIVSKQKLRAALAMLASLAGMYLSGCGGRALPLSTEGLLGPAILTGSGSSRTDGVDLGNIYPVTRVIAATSGNPYTLATDLPFTGAPVALGQPVTDGQTPFHFDFSYPTNNYKLGEAHIVIDTQRDTSDTEGVFVDGIFSGRPPTTMVNLLSPFLTFPIYLGNPAGYTPNTYYIDWAIAHYKRLTRNTFDLNMDDLVKQTPVRPVDLVKDGRLPVVTGDDSPVYQGFLVLKGYTISRDPLVCQNSPTYTFQNVFLHNDGDSIGQAAFAGTVLSPSGSWSTASSAPHSVEWFYDAQLPRVTTANVTVSTAQLAMTVKRNTLAGATSAIVINGVGVSEAGFDTTSATAAVESWDTGAARTYFSAWIAAIPADGLAHAVTLDLLQLLGATRARTLLAQGKFNLAIAGGLSYAQASGPSSKRGFGVVVSGPELSLAGSYFTELCEVPNDPSSPLNDNDPVPSTTGDHSSPTVSSLQAAEITSSSAVIQWLTNEPATSQASYGVGNVNTSTVEDSVPVTFHSVTLTGLLPYKVYQYQIRTVDRAGNPTLSAKQTFQTLR